MKKNCKNASLHAKNLMQMKNKYVHVKAEVLRISKLVHFLRIDQIWSHYQAKQEIWRKLNIHFEFQQWEKEMTHFNTKTSIAPFIFYQIQHPGTVLNAEFSQLSESAIGFQIWVINYEEITKLQSGHLSFLRLYFFLLISSKLSMGQLLLGS